MEIAQPSIFWQKSFQSQMGSRFTTSRFQAVLRTCQVLIPNYLANPSNCVTPAGLLVSEAAKLGSLGAWVWTVFQSMERIGKGESDVDDMLNIVEQQYDFSSRLLLCDPSGVAAFISLESGQLVSQSWSFGDVIHGGVNGVPFVGAYAGMLRPSKMEFQPWRCETR